MTTQNRRVDAREMLITYQPTIAGRQTQHLKPEADQRPAAAGRPFITSQTLHD